MALKIPARFHRFETNWNKLITAQSEAQREQPSFIAEWKNCNVSAGTGRAPVAFSSCQLQSPHPYTRART